MDELSIAQSKINQLTRRVEELEELIRTARLHALDQQIKIDNLEVLISNKDFCEKCEEHLEERYCFACYDELIAGEDDNSNDEMTQQEFREWNQNNLSEEDTPPHSPYSKIHQD